MFAFLMGLSAAISAEPGQVPAGTTKPILRNALTLFNAGDYPAEADAAGESGRVVAEVVVSPDGKVGGCRIVESSLSKSLDNFTCSRLMERASFIPAMGSDGKPVASTHTYRISWRSPAGPGGMWRDNVTRNVFRIERGNRAGACRVEWDEVLAKLFPKPSCEPARQAVAAFLAELPSTENHQDQELVMEMGHLKGGGADTLTVGHGADQRLLDRWSIEVGYDENAKPVSCRPGKNDPISQAFEKELCDIKVEERNVPDVARKAHPRTMVIYQAVYLRPATKSAPRQ